MPGGLAQAPPPGKQSAGLRQAERGPPAFSWEKYPFPAPPQTPPLDALSGPRHNGAMKRIEEQIAHLTRALEDLSDTVARQDAEIALLTRRVEMLMRREAQRDEGAGGSVTIGDERPPHY